MSPEQEVPLGRIGAEKETRRPETPGSGEEKTQDEEKTRRPEPAPGKIAVCVRPTPHLTPRKGFP